MTAPDHPDPESVRFDPYRASLWLIPYLLVVVTLFTAFVVWVWPYVVDPDEPLGDTLLIIVTVATAPPTVAGGVSLTRAWRSPAIQIDSNGVWLDYGDTWDVLPWDAIAAVGLGWQWRSDSGLPLPRWRPWLSFGSVLEIYPRDGRVGGPDGFESCRVLRGRPSATVPEAPVPIRLPSARYVLWLPTTRWAERNISTAVIRYKPEAWIGRHTVSEFDDSGLTG